MLQLFPHRPRDQSGYIGRMHVFLARSYRLVPAAKYHIDATLQLFAIENTFSCFCNYLCCGIASTKPLALPYIPSVPMASGKHIFMSVAVLLTSQASTSSILPFAPYFVYFHQVFNNFTSPCNWGYPRLVCSKEYRPCRKVIQSQRPPIATGALW